MLNKNTKLYGPMNALDVSKESTCWNSDGQADGDIDLSFVINFLLFHVLFPEFINVLLLMIQKHPDKFILKTRHM